MAIWPLALGGCLLADECREGESHRAVAYGSPLEAGDANLPRVEKIPLLGRLLSPGALLAGLLPKPLPVGSAALEWMRSVFP